MAAVDPELKKVLSKPLMKSADMTQEQSAETMEIVVMAIDKFSASANYEKAAQMIKEMMDKKFGPAWHVAMGEGYGFDVSYNTRHLLYMFYSGLGILVFKC